MRTSTITEGGMVFRIPHLPTNTDVPKKSDEVFFNPHQEFNRDFSVLVLRAFAKFYEKDNLKACEPFGGIGIRTCRYAIETPFSDIYYNDVNSNAFRIAKSNIQQLKREDQAKIHLFNNEYTEFLNILLQDDQVFDFIDIDPYGTPIPYSHGVIKLINKSGLLAFTATDLASLTGLYPKALYAKYGIGLIDKRIGNIHELAARSLITGLQRVGLIYNQSLIPIITLYYRHFIRTFMIRRRGVEKVLSKTGFLCKCRVCHHMYQSDLIRRNPSCPNCRKAQPYRIGPIYLGPLHKDVYLKEIKNDQHIQTLNDPKTVSRLVNLMCEENSLDLPWSYDIQNVAKHVGTPIPPMDHIIQKLNEKGFKCYKTHFSGSCLKTDAHFSDLCEVIRISAR